MNQFGLYLRDIDRFDLLTAVEERRLVRLGKRGDKAARDAVISANLRLVVYIAKLYRHRGLSIGDLVAEGNIGLFKAFKKFDPRRKLRFSTYAGWWIRQCIGRALDEAHLFHIPKATLTDISKAERGEPVRLSEDVLGSGRKLLVAKRRAASLESSHHPSNEPVDELERQDELARLPALLKCIPPREALIVKRSAGIGQKVHSLQELSEEFGVSKARLVQLKRRSLDKMRRLA